MLVTGRSRRHSRRGRTNRAWSTDDCACPRIVAVPERHRGRDPPRADLLDELLDGTDDERARSEPSSSGTTSADQQRVAVVDYPSTVPEDRAFHGVRRAAQNLGARPLLGSRREPWSFCRRRHFRGLRFGLRSTPSWGRWTATSASEGSASERQTCHARIERLNSCSNSWPTATGGVGRLFDDLGVFQILAEAQDPNTVHRFVRKWLGALLDYDGSRSADLVADTRHLPRNRWQLRPLGP